MLNTYKAILKGDHLEWNGEIPEEVRQDLSVVVLVTILEEKSQRGRRMAEALEKLALADTLKDVPDPAAWEREIRQDRQLLR